MTSEEKKVIQAVIKALNVQRNRFGKLDGDYTSSNDMQAFAKKLGIPHGGLDRADQCVMVLQLLIGEKATSILDQKL